MEGYERGAQMDYAFESSNMGTVEFSVTGEYANGCKDIDVACTAGKGWDFEEVDDADEIMNVLVGDGMGFESRRSMAFNRCYIQSVLIDRDATEGELLDEAASWTDEDVDAKLQYIAGA